jgi:transposase-like protein
LPKRLIKEKLTKVEAIALQLELEDELLQDWRKNFAKVNSSDDKKKKKDKPSA